MTYSTKNNQSIIDIALQVYAGIDNCISLIDSNNIDFWDDPINPKNDPNLVEQNLIILYNPLLIYSQNLVNFVNNNRITINTYG